MDKYTKPHFAKSVLITIDTQNDFTLDNAPAQIAGTKEIIPNIIHLLNSYRKKGLLIIHVVRIYLRNGSNVDLCRRELVENGKEVAVPGSDGAELVSELKPDSLVKLNPDILLSGKFQKICSNEYLMYKPRWGAFYETHLESFLKERGVDTIIISGCNFPNCPRTSIYEASERDFRVVLAKDAVSQLYHRGEEEMKNIGVSLMTTREINTNVAGFKY